MPLIFVQNPRFGGEALVRWVRTASAGLAAMGFVLAGCTSSPQASWAVFPLQRRVAHDGLAVVSQPDGFGLHLFLETDTRDPGVCKPRWFADAARLLNGNGTAPFSAGLAPRREFFEVVQRESVLQALCADRAPKARWQWVQPPTTASEVVPVSLPALEEQDLLTDPAAELKREEALLKDDQPGS